MNQKEIITLLLVALIAVLLIGGGAYVYMQNKQTNQPAVVGPTTQTAQTEAQQSPTQVVIPSKADTLEKLKAANPAQTEVVSKAWTAAEKLSIDNSIKKLVVYSRSQAEMYYNIGNSYANVCTNINGLLGTRNELSKLSGSVVCKDSSTAWAISAQLTNSTPQYQCADNLGSLIIRTSPITTTKCN